MSSEPQETQGQQTVEQAVDQVVRDVNRVLRRRGWSFNQPSVTPDATRAWGRAMAGARKWDSAAMLADYLASEFSFWTGHRPTPEERADITRVATGFWTDAVSERVVPTVAPTQPFAFAVCAFTPCRRTFDSSTGCFGAFCSASCLTAEVEQPGMFASPVPLCSDDDEARLA